MYQSINGNTPWQNVAGDRKEETHYQYRTEEYIEGEDASTGQSGTYKHNPSYQYYNYLVKAQRSI